MYYLDLTRRPKATLLCWFRN